MINSAKIILDTFSEIRDLACFKQNGAYVVYGLVLKQKVHDLHSARLKWSIQENTQVVDI